MCVRVVYSVVQAEYILWDGRKIPDPIVHKGGHDVLQSILEDGERKSPVSWLVDKERMNAFYEATQQVELRRCGSERPMFNPGYRGDKGSGS